MQRDGPSEAHELLEEHGIEGELEEFFEELYGGDSDAESGQSLGFRVLERLCKEDY